MIRSRVVRIYEDTLDALRKRAARYDSVDSTIRRLLGLPEIKNLERRKSKKVMCKK